MLLDKLSPDTGMAFVVVHHLRHSPTFLPAILSRHTLMPVELASAESPLEPNHVYILPSGKEIRISDGVLRLRPLSKTRGWSNVVTLFLQSLAESGRMGIAVILSGIYADGAAALRDPPSTRGYHDCSGFGYCGPSGNANCSTEDRMCRLYLEAGENCGPAPTNRRAVQILAGRFRRPRIGRRIIPAVQNSGCRAWGELCRELKRQPPTEACPDGRASRADPSSGLRIHPGIPTYRLRNTRHTARNAARHECCVVSRRPDSACENGTIGPVGSQRTSDNPGLHRRKT